MLSVCLLTFNSERLLKDVIRSLIPVADEFIVIDSGSTDGTLEILNDFGIPCQYHVFSTHAQQMNYAVSLAKNDWVLCMDSDEILDDTTIAAINQVKENGLDNEGVAYSLSRYWFVLGKPVRTIYPVSSPDYPIRLYNRHRVKFNDSPVDDAAEGDVERKILPGRVRHDTFYSLHEVFNKLNNYTSRVVKYKNIRPSLGRGAVSAFGAMFKWYLLNGSWKDGKVGFVTGVYAVSYSFMKYFKAWFYATKNKPQA
ncbi:glycosyltransferase family 2 protein [Erwiniaceae bacterium CAU 1747]